MFGEAAATIARHSKIASFDIAQTAQLLEECPIERIAARFAQFGCGMGRMNNGDAIDPCGLLRSRHNWPCCRATDKTNKFPPPHALVPAQVDTLSAKTTYR